MIVVPGTYAYYVPNVNIDIVFYHGYWYRPYEGRWYRAKLYNGPRGYIATPKVPSVLVTLPPDYRAGAAGYEHIPYGQLKKHWDMGKGETLGERVTKP